MPMLQLAQHILDRAHAAGRGITICICKIFCTLL